MVKDPVGGLVIDEKPAVAQSEYKGKTYYFMSLGNKKTFDRTLLSIPRTEDKK